MSYDLFFRVPAGRQRLQLSEFLGYFKGRRGYETSPEQAFYTNEATGVYFGFEFGEKDEDEGEEMADGSSSAGVAFNMNYYRPHVFALEAEPEVTSFVRHFRLLIDDPQTDGMGRSAYTPEGFLRGWNAGNQFGYRAIGEQSKDERPPTLPTAEIERTWRWNFGVEKLQKKFGEEVFVAKIMFLHLNGQVKSFAVWPDGIPIALPDTDLVLLGRQELAPKRLLRKPTPDHALSARSVVSPILKFGKRVEAPAPHTLFSYPDRPAEVTAFFKALRAESGELPGISVDHILNRELLPS